MTTPTTADLERERAQQPAWPPGEPDDRWTTDELRAYADHHQRYTRYEPPAPIAWDQLTQPQLAALAQCTTEAEAQALLAAFARGEAPPTPNKIRPTQRRSRR